MVHSTTGSKTLAEVGQARCTVRGSEFIGLAAPVVEVAEAEEFINDVRADHADATHVVPAYRVWVDGMLRAWSSDAGEPAGSAGKPIRSVLAARELEDVVAVIVRYFGGTELGIGGLSRAYARAAGEAVDAAGVVSRHPHEALTIVVEYDDSGTVRGILERETLDFAADYADRVTFRITAPVLTIERIRDRVLSATRGRATIRSTEGQTG